MPPHRSTDGVARQCYQTAGDSRNDDFPLTVSTASCLPAAARQPDFGFPVAGPT